MSTEIQDAVEDAVLRAKHAGSVLAVGETARQIAAAQGASGDEVAYQIARAIIEEAAQRGVAMQFTH